MPIADVSDFIYRSSGGGTGNPNNVFWHKLARIAGAAAPATIAGRPCTLWRYDGHPGAGAAPTSVEAPDHTTAGALPFVAPGSGRDAYMTQAFATGLVGGTLVLYDRLLHIGGLSGTVTTAQTVGGTLTRNTGGHGNMIMVEIYTAIGTTARTITASYTNQAGTSTRTTQSVQIGATGFLEATRAIFLPLQSGDSGVREVASVTLSATTGTAGNFGVTILQPRAYIAIGGPGAAGWRDFLTGMPGIPAFQSGACPALVWYPSTTTAPEFFGGYATVEAEA
jgi:hypothetical protein